MDYDQDGRTDLFIDTPNPRASSWPHYRVLRSDPEHKRFVLIDTEVVHPDATPFDADNTVALATGQREHYRFVRLGDLNGDGVADLIECLNPTADFSDPLAPQPGNPSWNVHVWEQSLPDGSGPGWDPTPIPITPIDGKDDCTVGLLRDPIADLDGDGVSEMVVQLVNGTFGGFRLEGKTWKESLTNLAVEPNPPSFHKIHFLDLNGDGLSDALVSSVARGPTLYPLLPVDRPADFGPTAPADVPYHALNDGKSFSALNPTLSKSLLPIKDNPDRWTDWWADYAIGLDYNGDGRMDFAMPVDPSGNESGIPSWYVFVSSPTMKGNFSLGSVLNNLGAGDMKAIPLDIPTIVDGISGVPVTWFLPQVSDVRGRGRHDLVYPNPNSDGTFVVYLNGDAQDQLVSVTDGMSALDPGDPGFVPTVSIDYESLVDTSITHDISTSDPLYEKQTYIKRSNPNNTCTYPRTCVVGPSRVVSSYQINDGQNQPRHFSVEYRDARYHRLGRGMLGFGERIVVDDETGAGTAELYDNMTWDQALEVFPFAGQMVESWSWGPASAVPPKSSGQPGKPTQVELRLRQGDAAGGADQSEDVLRAPDRRGAETLGGDLRGQRRADALSLRRYHAQRHEGRTRRRAHGDLQLRHVRQRPAGGHDREGDGLRRQRDAHRRE